MSKILVSIAALGFVGAASLPLPATAAERHDGVTNPNVQQTTDVSAQRRWRRHYGYYYGPRRYYGPRYRYPYYAGGYPYYGYGHPYGYYRPGIGVGIGPFGVRVF
jgi:hypothetical protein